MRAWDGNASSRLLEDNGVDRSTCKWRLFSSEGRSDPRPYESQEVVNSCESTQSLETFSSLSSPLPIHHCEQHNGCRK